MNFIYIEHNYSGCDCDQCCGGCGTRFSLLCGEFENIEFADKIESRFDYDHFSEKEKAILKAKKIADDCKWKYEEIIVGELICPFE
jgi:hypothetical protein